MARGKPSPRRLITAYVLWLWPFYPFYAMYLGRDMHCLLYTVTFGGFGLGWALDFLAMPLYVADHNEPDGYAERAQARARCVGRLVGRRGCEPRATQRHAAAGDRAAVRARVRRAAWSAGRCQPAAPRRASPPRRRPGSLLRPVARDALRAHRAPPLPP